MRVSGRVLSWVWNADAADNGALLITWGLAVLHWWWRSGLPGAHMAVIAAAALLVGSAKLVLSLQPLASREPWARWRIGLPVCAFMVWFGVAMDSVMRSPGDWGGWATVLYLWLAYRAAKSYLRLLSRYARQAMEAARRG